jgi:hypothetical protein
MNLGGKKLGFVSLHVESKSLAPFGNSREEVSPKAQWEGRQIGNMANRHSRVARWRRELQEEEHEGPGKLSEFAPNSSE